MDLSLYLVVRGSYEDCTVLRAFEDEGQAETWADHVNTVVSWHFDERARVEPVPFTPAGAALPAVVDERQS